MENRELVVAEYFRLRVLLNRANLVSNRNTEMKFEVVRQGPKSFVFVATLDRVRNSARLELCRLDLRRWDSSGYTGFFNLEDFCSEFLNRRWNFDLSEECRNILVTELHAELRSLGVSL